MQRRVEIRIPRPHANARVIAALVLLLIGEGSTAYAQAILPGAINPFGSSTPGRGFHLYDVSGFGTYESTALPINSVNVPSALNPGADGGFGGSAAVGWSTFGARSNFSIVYSASYTAMIRNTQLDGLSQFLAINMSRMLTSKWTAGFSLISGVSNTQQFMFTPTLFGQLADVPTTFQDLSSAVASGKFTSNQLASLLTGAPVLEAPARAALYGNRVFASSLRGNLEYDFSGRLSITFSMGAVRAQHLNSPFGESQGGYLIPATTSGEASVGLSYALSPRTTIGVNASSSRIFSRFADSYSSTAVASIGRTMGRRWFARIEGGGGVVTPVRSKYAVSPGPRYTTGGSLGYKTLANTFLFSGTRAIADAYGFGATSLSGTAAWEWHRPGRTWGVFSSVGWERMRGSLFQRLEGWRVGSGLTKRLNRQMSLSFMYSYMKNTSITATNPFSRDGSGVRIVLSWSPGREW